ncbi:hypothetical protein Q7P35_004004 [Cladosporium inversicolor]
MSLSSQSARPLACLKQALRQCRAERQQQQTRSYAAAATQVVQYPSLQTRYPAPSKGFRTSQATKQNRFETGMRKIPVAPQVQSTRKHCPDPVATITASQIATLDPTGARTRLFSPDNVDRARVGDILLVRQKSGDPFSGVCLNIKQGDSKIDSSILLRNNLTRVGVEMSYKIYSPNVEGIEVVQRKAKRARRARLYYMRQPRHDVGSVENIVRQYMRQRAGGPMSGKNGKSGASPKKKSKKSKN